MKEVAELVWRLDSGRPGKKLMILGGVHGNEMSGITVVRDLLSRFIARPDDLVAGSLTLAFGNPRAIVRGMRGSAPHRDLNRCFDDRHRTDINENAYEICRAAELAPHIDDADVLIDLHSTNKPSLPFLTTTVLTPLHAVIGDLFDCDRLVLVSPSAIPGTTDGRVNMRGGVGIVYESGNAQDLSRIGMMRASVERTMRLLGLTSSPPSERPRPRQKRLYHLDRAHLLTEAGFAFADGYGHRSFDPVLKNDVIGHEGGAEVCAPYDGVLMFPKVKELWKVGSPVVFFARDAGRMQ